MVDTGTPPKPVLGAAEGVPILKLGFVVDTGTPPKPVLGVEVAVPSWKPGWVVDTGTRSKRVLGVEEAVPLFTLDWVVGALIGPIKVLSLFDLLEQMFTLAFIMATDDKHAFLSKASVFSFGVNLKYRLFGCHRIDTSLCCVRLRISKESLAIEIEIPSNFLTSTIPVITSLIL